MNDLNKRLRQNLDDARLNLRFIRIYGYIMNSHRDKLPHGLIAKLVEHCTVIRYLNFQALISKQISCL